MANIRINAISGTFTPTLYTAPTAISAAGNTNLTLPAVASDDYIELDGTTNGSRKQLLPRPTPVFNVTVSAGSAAYTATITAQTTNAVAGDEMEIVVAMPASFNPLVELHNATSGGTLLATFVGNTVARTWVARIRFTGAAWFLVGFSQQRAASIQEVADMRNTLAPRGGVALDGTASSRVSSVLTNQSIATDPFSLVVTVRVPSANPSATQGLGFIGPSSTSVSGQSNQFWIHLTSSGVLEFLICGASTADLNYADLTAFVANYGGKVVQIAFVRPSSGNPAIYINGVAQSPSFATSGTPPTWQGSITSTNLALGFEDNSHIWVGSIYSASLYNLALSASDVQEIFELNGGAPERYKWGSQTDATPTARSYTNGASDANNTTGLLGLGTKSAVGGARTAGAGSFFARSTASGSGQDQLRTTLSSAIKTGQSITINAWVQVSRAGTYGFNVLDNGGGSGSAISTEQTQALLAATWTNIVMTFVVTAGQVAGALTFGVRSTITATAGDTMDFDDVVSTVRGAVGQLPLDDGLGFELQDVSTNKLHAAMTATGVSHVVPSYGPANVRTTTNTNGNQQLFGQVCIPANAQIIRARARAQTNTPTVTLGTSSGGSQVVASIALSTVWKDLTIALTGGTVGSSNISLWAGSNSTDVVEWDVKWEPLSP